MRKVLFKKTSRQRSSSAMRLSHVLCAQSKCSRRRLAWSRMVGSWRTRHSQSESIPLGPFDDRRVLADVGDLI